MDGAREAIVDRASGSDIVDAMTGLEAQPQRCWDGKVDGVEDAAV